MKYDHHIQEHLDQLIEWFKLRTGQEPTDQDKDKFKTILFLNFINDINHGIEITINGYSKVR
jgi:hypothetical protein